MGALARNEISYATIPYNGKGSSSYRAWLPCGNKAGDPVEVSLLTLQDGKEITYTVF